MAAAIQPQPYSRFFWTEDRGETYRATAQIGEGYYSNVYRVIGQDKNEYALKVMKKCEKAWDLVWKEATQLHQAQGVPHILKIFKLLFLDNRCFSENQPSSRSFPQRRYAILMELGQGVDLLACKQLRVSEITSIAKQGLETLAALSKNNIVHRDIKPENFLYDNEKDQLTLIDFGFAQKAEHIDANKFEGTFWYASPEAIMQKSLSPSSDMWSFGALLFELITGKPLIKTNPDFDEASNSTDHFHLLEQQMGELPSKASIPDKLFQEGYFRLARDGGVKVAPPPSDWMSEKMADMSKRFGATTSAQAPMWQSRLRDAMKKRGANPSDTDFFLHLISSMLVYEHRITAEDALGRFFTISEEKTG